MDRILLNTGWKLLEMPLSTPASQAQLVLGVQSGWMDCSLPCDVHMPLMAYGAIKDPVLADYCFDSEWTQQRSWWFKRTFNSAAIDRAADICELTLESIDAHADVFLNGVHIGHHVSAFYPFVRDVKRYLIDGTNTLLVRVTTGLETVSDDDLAEINFAVCTEEGNGCPERGDKRRAFVRRPGYSIGWDWGPKAPTCGIVKGAWISCLSKAVVRSVNTQTVMAQEGGKATLALEIETELISIIDSANADFDIEITYMGETVAANRVPDVFLASGLNYTKMVLCIDDARLWWPNGYGEQPLYTVNIRVTCDGTAYAYPAYRIGLRTIAIDMGRIDKDNRRFALRVNGVNIFCKGGNWIPADSIYARIPDGKYQTLVEEAKEANFNMLRVWGGGFYERDLFYDLCDEHGILVWQDFMFACSLLPDHREAFQAECRKEMDYQTKHLRNHSSLALFCGNNEIHSIFCQGWGVDLQHDKQHGMYLANTLARSICHANCPQIPYWNSSPYGGKNASSENCGDCHQWGEFMMNREMSRRISPLVYDESRSKFVSEYGYPGSCRLESIEQYFDGQPVVRGSKVWNMHNNTFEKDTVAAGIEKHYVDNPMQLPLVDYIEYSGIVQSMMYGYSLEAFRSQPDCGGGLFWMYNDTWGEVGWTIIDYYLRRKISYFGVKRSFAPIKAILRQRDGQVCVTLCNDTALPVQIKAKAGLMSLDGANDATQELAFDMPARSRVVHNLGALPSADYRNTMYAFLPNARCEPEFLRIEDHRKLQATAPEFTQTIASKQDDVYTIELRASTYVHMVHIDQLENITDNYFDLFPGQVKRVTVRSAIQPVFTAL